MKFSTILLMAKCASLEVFEHFKFVDQVDIANSVSLHSQVMYA